MDRFDFSGMDIFWEIFDLLQADREPTEELWDRLFATPGYAVLVKSEFTRDFFISRFRLAFKPSLAEELEKEPGQDKHGFLSHYLTVRKNPGAIKRQQQLLASGDYHHQVMDRCLEWLPLKEVDEYPPVSFVIFQNDARGYSPVVVDVLAAIELGEFIPLFLAHEFHHWYRNKLLAVDWSLLPEEYNDLVWVLDQLHAEGIADHIDKAALMAADHPFARGFDQAVEKAPEYIEFMDTVLGELTGGERQTAEAGRELRNKLPQAGHPVGYYMAREIIKRKGRKALIATVPDTFSFFRQWDGFSSATREWLDGLQAIAQSKD